ncbi:hypothetical protein [Arsukibacterium sp.]|uniref:hypothetical protein n=1 Tax=Arsukibacterium sp. TaxID=1977258 RepID=UPI002FDA18DD
MARDNVGVISCPFTGQLSVVREDKRGKLYYYSQAGKIAPNLPAGQRWLQGKMQPLENYTINATAAGFPPDVKPLTQQPAATQAGKPLTEQHEETPGKKPGNWWE